MWIDELHKAIANLIVVRGKYFDNTWSKNQTLWAELSEGEFDVIRKMIKVIKMNNIRQVKQKDEVLISLGSTKQND